MYTVDIVSKSCSFPKSKFLEFCKKSYESNTSPACANMWNENWEECPETLPFLIYKSDRFHEDNGVYFILSINDVIEASSGIYISEFDKNVAIGGVRSWTNSGYKANLIIGRYIFPKQILWAKLHGIKTIALTFNDYNKKLMSYFTRNGIGVVKNRTPDMLFYNGVNVLSHSVIIQHTKQWVIYHKIDENYEPDWKLIEYKDI